MGYNRRYGDTLTKTPKLLFLIAIISLMFIPIGINAQRDPCADITPPDQITNLRTEQFGRLSTLLTWTMDFNRENFNANHFVIQRSDDGRNFADYDIVRKIPEKSRTERTDIEKFQYLDEAPKLRFTMYYKVKAGTDTFCYSPLSNTASTEITERDGITLFATGSLIEDRSEEPLTRSSFEGFVAYMLGFEFFKSVFAQFSSSPLVTTGLNPQAESYLFGMTPIPVPNQYLGFPCTDNLNVIVKNDQAFGQIISFDVTLFDNQTAVLTENFDSIMANRFHSKTVNLTDVQSESIQNYQDLFVSIDNINGLAGDPRAMEIWQIEFLVPEDSGACS